MKEMLWKLEKSNVDVHMYDGEHGFSDPYAASYNRELAYMTCKQTIDFFRNNGMNRVEGSTS
ncbi:hypothetical protein SporoS204_02300 [Sporosarcina ureae]|uniref:Uncharacterized protein n=1 Tax=Sporosarcina ureae TaxID=1571 RepID=A0ABN4YMA5_SPOUR|nr:hypothetical protein SporoS204_02300 [Sporosarcina ureae]